MTKQIFIIYIIGCIASFIANIKIYLDKRSKITILTLEIALFESLFSWISFIDNLLCHYEDTEIYRKKHQNN